MVPPDPGNTDKQARREVVSDDVEAHLAGEDQLETRRAVVHTKSHVVLVHRSQGLEGYSEDLQW